MLNIINLYSHYLHRLCWYFDQIYVCNAMLRAPDPKLGKQA